MPVRRSTASERCGSMRPQSRAASKAGRSSTLRLFCAIQLAAAVPVLSIGAVLDVRYQQQETAETLRDARSQAELLADLVIAPQLLRADLRSADPAAAQASLAGALGDPDLRAQIDGVTVWDLTGRVVASDDPSQWGKASPPDDAMSAAAGGVTTAEVSASSAVASADGLRAAPRTLDVYTPLRTVTAQSTITGVLELHLPYAELAGDLARTSTDLHRDIAVALAGLLAALAALTWPVLRRLARHVDATERAATTDALTGLLNRTGLEGQLAAGAAAGRSGIFVLADVGGLHQINEALGHSGGDELLRGVGTRLQALLETGLVARTGGGEFAVVLPDVSDVDGPDEAGTGGPRLEVLRGLRERLAAPLEIAGVPITPVLALGAAPLPGLADAVTPFQHAGRALQLARRRTSGVAVSDECSGTFDAGRLRLLTELRSAVPMGQLRLHYQPQVDTRTGRTTSYEALLRWQHPERGLLGPGEFLPMAERTGLVTTLTDWVVAEAARQQAEWMQAGLQAAVSVNISARDLADPHFAVRTAETVRRAGAQIAKVHLELTETALVEDPTGAQVLLNHLATAGFWLSLDDFGQGATSLAQLSDLPLDELKLDRAFVAGMDRSAADAAIVTSVVQLAHNLGLVVVAEGVESAEQARVLTAAGYDVLQGWHLGRPVPAELVSPLLAPSGECTGPGLPQGLVGC